MLHFLTHEAERISFAKPDLLQTFFSKYTQVYRTTESLDFLKSCIYRRVIPFFAKIPPNDIKKLGINLHEQPTIEKRKLEKERNSKSLNLAVLEKELDILSKQMFFFSKAPFEHL